MAVASVRPATVDDVDEIVRIQAITWRTAYAEFVPEQALARLSDPAAREAWTAALAAGEGHHVLVATEGEWTVGFCAAAPARADDPEAPAGRGQIVTVLVEPRWGRRGHGRRLLGAAFEALAAGGATEGVAWVPEPDVASRACYDRIGWDPDGMVRTLDAGDRELREIRLAGPLRIENRDPRRHAAQG
ncbi:GNAT family N-acetyltransferase [Pseudonocardia acaciae]|uniref:GNAT family N-acetyltransferase n=1 Tax=Pseudonocardia acaciae TaxID=551276 RepID=UPI00048B316A|nr:GNAT family N-acetyltransferase [Pseudonocardia acaciae]